jgi:CRP-like cAMP-binding protein
VDEALSRSGLFYGLPAEVIEPVASQLETVTVPCGGVLFSEGELGDALYIVLDGNVQLTRRSQQGAEKVLAVLGPSDHFGELAVFEPCLRTETATAVTDVRLARAPHAVLRPWIEAHPEIGERLLRVLARRLWGTKPWLPDLFFTDVPGRLAKVLMLLADKFGRRDREGLRIQHDVSLQELSGLVGASRETVEKSLTDFANRGWIRLDGTSLLILNQDQLRRRER